MQRGSTLFLVLTLAVGAGFAAYARADEGQYDNRGTEMEPMSLTNYDYDQDMAEEGDKKDVVEQTTVVTTYSDDERDYKGVDDFFNIREANSNVRACEWQFEIDSAWTTFHSRKHRDDDITASPSIKYGFTDDLFAELQLLPVNFGDGLNLPNSDGADGTGDIALKLFWQFLHEDDNVPAMAIWGAARVPTGENSSKMDATLNLNMTKTLGGGFRAHLGGFVATTNGARGDWDRDEFGDRRHFQWGVGPGVDYQINECNWLVFNYLNKCSDHFGLQNNNILEMGWVWQIDNCSSLRAAVDAETHADTDGGHWTAKVQYALNFGSN